MISINTLRHLSSQRQRDAGVLFKGGRYGAAVYLMGYAIEYTLKRQICLSLRFNQGFPELDVEFSNYDFQLAMFNTFSTGIRLNQLRQIKSHRLSDLLNYSGLKSMILDNVKEDWDMVQDWSPEDRYKIRRYTKESANKFMKSSLAIINLIKYFYVHE